MVEGNMLKNNGLNKITIDIFLIIFLFGSFPIHSFEELQDKKIILYYFPFSISTLTPLSVMSLTHNANNDLRIKKFVITENKYYDILEQISNALYYKPPIKTIQLMNFITGKIEEEDITLYHVNTRIALFIRNRKNNIVSFGIGKSDRYFSCNDSVYDLDKNMVQLFYNILKEIKVDEVTDDYFVNFSERYTLTHGNAK
jgi:hypothetical protein